MLTEPTLDKLKAMRLDGLAAAWAMQRDDPEIGGLSFEERFGLMVDHEWVHREARRMKRNLTAAKLRLRQASLEDLEHAPERKLDRALVRRLATCRWIHEHRDIAITGATGTGKTYLACALAHHAIRHGNKALYSRASRLFGELRLAHADGTYGKVLARIARADVLVIDDFGMAGLKESQRHDLLEVLEDRHGQRSTIITSQLPPTQWHEAIGEPTVADAICDRVLHGAHRIALSGPSRRKSAAADSDEGP
ncbi:ATP-binding protein [bacterium]|nr:ATP-binding protein [bacterium]